MKLARACCLCLLLPACATARLANVEPGHPALVMEHHIAEGKGEGSDLPAKPNAAAPPLPTGNNAAVTAPSTPAAPPLSGSQPDPEPLVMKEQWEYQVLFSNGSASVEGAQKRSLPKPVPTPRRMGRFALELWIGHELIDRVRFDFPMIAAEDIPGKARRPLHDAPNLSPHATARVRVSLPASPRATRLMLLDRATGKAQELAWPPDRDGPLPPPAPVLDPAIPAPK